MPPVRIEAKAFDDARIVALGRRLGIDRFSALGRMAFIWRHCTEEETHTITLELADAVADLTGFSDACVSVGLATFVGPGLLKIKGTEGRIEWISHRREAARIGGLKSAEVRASKRQASAQANVDQVLEQTPSKLQPSYSYSGYGSSNLPDSCQADVRPPPPLTLVPVPSSVIAKPAVFRQEADAWVDWFNRKYARAYTSNKALVDQVKSLLAKGYTQRDLRKVTAYLHFKWHEDPKMRDFVKPSVILRITKFAERLDEAREWWGDDDAEAKG
jgi:uncharacterized protein